MIDTVEPDVLETREILRKSTVVEDFFDAGLVALIGGNAIEGIRSIQLRPFLLCTGECCKWGLFIERILFNL